MASHKCLVCDHELADSRFPGLLQCQTCTFITADLDLTKAELAALYTSKYFTGDEYSDYVADRKVTHRNFRNRLKVLLRHVANPKSKRLFEIGAAYGFFLEVAQGEFKEVAGIDISAEAADYARSHSGIDVSEGDFLEYQLDKPVDVACMWDTIEHLQSPHLYIEKLATQMPAGSTIAITTGDIGSVNARMRGAAWRQIHPPTHLHYFSSRTLAQLLDRLGFTVKHSEHSGMYRSLDMMASIILRVRRKQDGLYHALRKTGLLSLDVNINLFDYVYMIAEKRSDDSR